MKTPLIRCKNISYARKKQQILENVSLHICAGDIITIIGPNGAGKSTLGKILIGSLQPDSGYVKRKKGLKIGYMPQQRHINSLVPMTVMDFFLLNSDHKAATQENVDRIISENHLSGILSNQVTDISMGEWQRLLFSRILLQDPGLLILDEPIQGLDISGQKDFYTLLEKIRLTGTKSILMISHDLHTVMSSSNNVICLNRRICCSGMPKSIQYNQHYKDLFKRVNVISSYVHNHD